MDLAEVIYSLTEEYPKSEMYGLVSQMRRCSISIPSNISEGKGRGTQKDFRNFLRIAYASGNELETQLLLSKRFECADSHKLASAHDLLTEVLKMLNVLIAKNS